MNGVQHYCEAERFAGQAEKLFGEYVEAHDQDGSTPDVDLMRRQSEYCREMAALHATLALAAATAMGAPAGHDQDWYGMPDADAKAWCAVAGVKPTPAKDDEAQGGAVDA